MIVHGIGYEGRDLDSFIGTLTRSSIDVLVDVRLTPSSRKRGFSKTALSASLEAAGIDYLHLRDLGNAKDNRPGFSALTGDAAEHARAAYLAHLTNGSTAAVHDLVDTLRDRRAALLCYERDERYCHREVLIEHLQEIEPKLISAPL